MPTYAEDKPWFETDWGGVEKNQDTAKDWKGDPNIPAGQGTYHNPQSVATPPVPKGTAGSGTTQVDTPSMLLFAANIEQLLGPVKRAQLALKNVQVAPGAFYHANQLRSKVAGEGNGGLKGSLLTVLDDLEDGLTELCRGVRLLGKQYDTTEEQNRITAQQLEEHMHGALSDFGALERDAASVR